MPTMGHLNYGRSLCYAAVITAACLTGALKNARAGEPNEAPLLSKISVNGVPADSLVYNDAGQLTAVWSFNEITGNWNARREFSRDAQGRVVKMQEYWGADLMRSDSLHYQGNTVERYAMIKNPVTGKTTQERTQLQLNSSGRPVVLQHSRDNAQDQDECHYRGSNLARHAKRISTGNNQLEKVSIYQYDRHNSPFAALGIAVPGYLQDAFHQKVLLADAGNNVAAVAVSSRYNNSGQPDVATISCRYKYDPATGLPLEQSYRTPENETFNITFSYR